MVGCGGGDRDPGIGVDLAPMLREENSIQVAPQVCATCLPEARTEFSGMVVGSLKVTQNQRTGDLEFCDKEIDSAERDNRWSKNGQQNETIVPLADLLDAFFLQAHARKRKASQQPPLGREDCEMLKALGYAR
jgi:hypothetical protein